MIVGFMGAGKTTVGEEVAARLGRPFVDLDHEIELRAGVSIAELFATRGEAAFRALEEATAIEVLGRPTPSVVALGGGAPTSHAIRRELAISANTVLLEVDVDEAWRRVRGSGRPLALDERSFRVLFAQRRAVYDEVARWNARDADDVVLAAGSVQVEVGALERLGENSTRDCALVADAHVAKIHGRAAQAALGARLASTHELPVGEDAKTIAALERLLHELALDRSGILVALGGGCTTDVAGFAAAVYLRGVDWVAVPTTLVGQVDAAIGGKTAVNLPEAKNLVGAFHWPTDTVIDPSLLATLPEPQRREGMAEVVKTGLLAGEPLWDLPLDELVRRCAAYKTGVCLRDPYDRHWRGRLNLGHTFAHALEAGSDHAVSHGDAVALGLLAALRLSGRDDSVVRELLDPQPVRVDRERALEAIRRDKKRSRGQIRLVLLDEDGPTIEFVDEDDVRRALDELIAE
ncbi:MAG: bifunctional shikimate kinase/3-dehydroquinate synthase [Actinomycetota bacterium]|nr:bifunctional shikimate kinase/3-dehydroquinate synthase [Actinomycetota bacterium]